MLNSFQHLLKGSSNHIALYYSADPEIEDSRTPKMVSKQVRKKLTEVPMKRGTNYDLKQYWQILNQVQDKFIVSLTVALKSKSYHCSVGI